MKRRRLLSLLGAGSLSILSLLLGSCASEAPKEKAEAVPPPVAEPPAPTPVPEKYRAKFATTKGEFVIEVTRSLAPLAAERFYRLLEENYYAGCPVYRVRPGFVVQWGISDSPRKTNKWNQEYMPDEPTKLSNTRGTVSFAASGKDSRTMQVFVNLGNNAPLDKQGFSPFGRVISGMDVFAKFQSYRDDINQSQFIREGGSYIEMFFPKMDRITNAELLALP
ncbi:MAG: peptidylprolyl isomerase [Bryobacterales bacterium]|nr:peptidylprolyl isomerase [Bryobacterales bacterium]